MMIVVHGDEEAVQIVDHRFGNEKRSEEEKFQASTPPQVIEADTKLGLNGTKRFVEGGNGDENLEIEERQYYANGNYGYNRPYNRPRPYRPRPYNYYNQQSRPYAYNGRPYYGRRRRK